MTLDQLQKFVDSTELHVRQIALTREGARQILAEHEQEIANVTTAPKSFEIPVERDTPAYVALEQARVDRLLFGEA